MKLSDNGYKFVSLEEGKVLKIYLDSKGLRTCGIGHLIVRTDPEYDLVVGAPITEDRCKELFKIDSERTEDCLNNNITAKLSQNMYDALFSWSFNIGVTATRNSTLVKLLNSGDKAGAADQFLMWKKPPELLPRRKRERALFLS